MVFMSWYWLIFSAILYLFLTDPRYLYYIITNTITSGASVVVIVWQFKLHVPVKSVPKVLSSIPVHCEVCSIPHYVIKVCQWLVAGRWFSQGNLVSSTNKTDRIDTTETLLKVALNTITLTPNHKVCCITDYKCLLFLLIVSVVYNAT